MHILAVEAVPTRFAGGQERSLFEVLQLASTKHRIWLAYQDEGELLEKYDHFLQGRFIQKFRVFRLAKIHLILLEFIQALIFCTKNKISHIYVNQYFDLPFWALVSFVTNRPLICHLRLLAPNYLSRQYRFGLEKCSFCITISDATANSYIKHGIESKKFKTIYNAIDIHGMKNNQIKKFIAPINLVYAGRIAPEKGIELLLKAFEILSETNAYSLHIYGNVRGSNVPENYLELLKNNFNKLNNIYWHEHTHNLENIFQDKHIVIFPTLWEAFGRVILEGFVRGLPVISSNVGGIPEVYGSYADFFTFKSGNEFSLARKVEDVISDIEALNIMTKKMQVRIEKEFSYSNFLQKWESAFLQQHHSL